MTKKELMTQFFLKVCPLSQIDYNYVYSLWFSLYMGAKKVMFLLVSLCLLVCFSAG